MAYLVKPFKLADLAPCIAIAVRRFDQFKMLRQEATDLQQALADRNVIEQTKGVIMKKSGLDESEAFRCLQNLASEKKRKLVEIAAIILMAEETFQAL